MSTNKLTKQAKFPKTLPSILQPLALRSSNFSCKSNSTQTSQTETQHPHQEREREREREREAKLRFEGRWVLNMIGRRNDVEIVSARARRITTKEDLGAILLKSVVKRVEDLRGHEFAGHEDVGSFKRLRPQHRHLPLFYYYLLVLLSLTRRSRLRLKFWKTTLKILGLFIQASIWGFLISHSLQVEAEEYFGGEGLAAKEKTREMARPSNQGVLWIFLSLFFFFFFGGCRCPLVDMQIAIFAG
ncbi:hypothetical protein TorRG33x02_125950 [Trema orientale]|uniref:Uncharacterized protein n=1 Tax=Trema orientale TaxID=63057 RepID=A0A2P5F188_TREOI|nr:hypothetical protein TorRG33x02_125950 [Trema orientale]